MLRIIKVKIIFFSVFLCVTLFAQDQKLERVMVIRSSPNVSILFNLNYDQAMGQLAGTYNNDFRSDQFINGRSLGADKGFGAQIISKFSVNETGHFRVTASARFNHVSSYLFGTSGLADVGESKFNIYSFGIGIENNFTPNHKVKLFFGTEALFNMINGSAKIWVENKPNTPYTYDVKIKNSFRIGVGLSAGAEYLLSNNFGVNLGFNFTHANLLLRQSKATGDTSNINLNDEDSNPFITYSGKKQFTFLTVTAGVNFYFGIKEKRYVLSKK